MTLKGLICRMQRMPGLGAVAPSCTLAKPNWYNCTVFITTLNEYCMLSLGNSGTNRAAFRQPPWKAPTVASRQRRRRQRHSCGRRAAWAEGRRHGDRRRLDLCGHAGCAQGSKCEGGLGIGQLQKRQQRANASVPSSFIVQ